MNGGLYTVDFHTHLQDGNTQLRCCPQDSSHKTFKAIRPFFEQLAAKSEPLHDQVVSFLALNNRDRFSRYLYTRLGKLGLMEVLRLFNTYNIEALIARMDRNGVDHAVIHSIEPLTSTANILKMTEPYRERVSVFASVEKENPDPVGYLKPFLESGSVSGIKIHPIVGGYACGELPYRMGSVAGLATQYDLPILIHTGHIPTEALNGLDGCTEVEALEPLIRDYPTVTFILAHIGWESWRKVLDLCERYENTMVETSWQPAKVIRRAVDRLGSSRVLFGSDFPLFKQSIAIKHLKNALSGKELVEVYSTNAMKLLRIKEKSDSAGRAALEKAGKQLF